MQYISRVPADCTPKHISSASPGCSLQKDPGSGGKPLWEAQEVGIVGEGRGSELDRKPNSFTQCVR